MRKILAVLLALYAAEWVRCPHHCGNSRSSNPTPIIHSIQVSARRCLVSAPQSPKPGDQGLPKTVDHRAGTCNKATISLREKLKAGLVLFSVSTIMTTGCRTIASPAWGWMKAGSSDHGGDFSRQWTSEQSWRASLGREAALFGLMVIVVSSFLTAQEQAQPKPSRFDLTPLLGYRTGMSFETQASSGGANPRVILEQGPSYGLAFGF